MGIGRVLTMPLFFASNALYPTAMLPIWLQTISRLNPLTYVVDALRSFMLAGSTSRFGFLQNFGANSSYDGMSVSSWRKTLSAHFDLD